VTVAKVPLKKRLFLGDILVEMNFLTKAQATEALAESQRRGVRVGQVVLEKNWINEVDLSRALAKQHDLGFVDLRTIEPTTEALGQIPHSVATQIQVLPLTVENSKLILAVSDPSNLLELSRLEKIVSMPMELVVAPDRALRLQIENAYMKRQAHESTGKGTSAKSLGGGGTGAGAGPGAGGGGGIKRTLHAASVNVGGDVAGETETLVNRILEQAIGHQASDIHIEPQEGEVQVRERVDGRLENRMELPSHLHPALVSRLKILGGLDIAEKRVPQDGRFMHQVSGRSVDFRISTLPTIRGEKVVLRILDKGNMKIGLAHLGMSDAMASAVRKILAHPHGILLVSGPTGSGKTTTVYSMLDEINKPDVNITTIEDPVEYKFDVINQVQVNAKAGLTFAGILRNILRQDPDVIMVGEIRDRDTAEIAIRAALTGHLVISTIHTNDSLTAVTRLVDMGIDPFLISSSLLGVIAQRLVRRLCKHCQVESREITDGDSELANQIFKKVGVLRRPKGCPECFSSGYQGREGIYEVLTVGRELRKAISESMPVESMRDIVAKSGFTTMRDHGISKVIDGITSVEEILRSTVDMNS